MVFKTVCLLLLAVTVITKIEAQNYREAELTWYTSWPLCCTDPDADPTECDEYNGCRWAGYFAYVDGQKDEDWVRARNIIAIHEKDGERYKLKTFEVRQGDRYINATVYDHCSDSDCNGCCTRNAQPSNFLIDMESHTRNRFGSGSGRVEWRCLDC